MLMTDSKELRMFCKKGVLLFIFVLSCTRTIVKERPATSNSVAAITEPQKVNVEQQVYDGLLESYSAIKSLATVDMSWAQSAARLHVEMLKRAKFTHCDLGLAAFKTLQKCLILEVMSQTAPEVEVKAELVNKIDSMTEKLSSIRPEIELLVGQVASENLPFIAKSFFEGKKFVLTTSLQQGSVGNFRVYNLESISASLAVNSNRLVVLQNSAGQFPSTDALDSIITSYPILATKSSGPEVYYQVDFSKPENSRMFRTALLDSNDPALDIQADLIIPTIAHKPKVLDQSLNSTQYFNSQDSVLVVDSLVLISGDFEPNDTDLKLGKDTLHSTMRVVQGLFAEQVNDQKFAEEQALDISAASDAHLQKNTNDLSDGQDLPYFTTSPYLADLTMGGFTEKSRVKKFDSSKDIVFVLSSNTPAKAVPVLKAAVETYNAIFAGFKKGQDTHIFALSAEEFAAEVRASGADLPEYPIAADPRVNMLSWSNDDALGAAWATSVAHPFSGKVISGDVMISGNLWAQVGCGTYVSRIWAQNLKRGDAISSLVPTDEDKRKWGGQCAAAMKRLGFDSFGKSGPTNLPKNPTTQAFDAELSNLPMSYHASLAQFGSQDLASILHAPKEAKSSNSVTLSRGKNTLKLVPNCSRRVEVEKAFATNFGGPGLDQELIKDPEQGALAMVRSVVIHELGHLFGLRHNFAGSLVTAKLKSPSPLPLMNQSDSVMDYNDYGVDMSAGAMKDYSSPLGGKDTETLGVYDVLALGQIYDLNTAALSLESKPSFCTDGNVKRLNGNPYGDCKPDDFGTSDIAYSLHQLNQDLLTLKAIGLPLDAGTTLRLQARLAGSIQALTFELFMAQEKLTQNKVLGVDRDILVQKIQDITSGQMSDPLITNWSAFTGLKPQGLLAALEPKQVDFKNENTFLRKYDALIAKKVVNQSFIQTVAGLASYRKSQMGDSKFAPIFKDIPSVPEFNWKTRFIGQFASEVILPKGTSVEFNYFDDGKIVIGAEAKLDNVPVEFILDAPMLNHNKVVQVKKIIITGADGAPKEVVATASGKYTIDDLKLNASLVAIIDPYGDLASSRLNADKQVLLCLSGAGTPACEGIKPLADISLIAARSLLKSYEKLAAFIQDPEAGE